MSKQKRPEIGTVMWDVHESMYYVKGYAGPFKEYVVASAPISGFLEGGFVELCMTGPVLSGDMIYNIPRRHKLADIGKKVFYTAREAALYAKELTEKYERTWGWCLKRPLRRTWEKYLEETI